jgi:arylsulfatase A-like enzyme
MEMKRVNTTFFSYTLVLAAILTIFLAINTFLSPIINDRLIYNFFYFGCSNFIILMGLSFLVNFSSPKIPRRWRTILFFFISSAYALFFIAMSVSYLSTGQVIRIQTLMFVYKIFQKHILILVGAGILFGTILVSWILNRTFRVRNIKTSELKWSKIFFYGAIFILLFILLFIKGSAGIKDPVVSSYDKGRPVLFESERRASESLFSYKTPIENPNVIFILLESVTSEKLGAYGYSRNTTPNIDNLAEKSTIFMNTYTTATHSDYAQPTYLSSNYVLINNYRNQFLEPHEGHFPWDILKKEGYKTAYISSQDDHWADMGNYYNYENLDLYRYSLSDLDYGYGGGLAKKDFDEDTMDDVLKWINEITTKCKPILKQNTTNNSYEVSCSTSKEIPFFTYINLQGTHEPYIFPDSFTHFSSSTKNKNEIEIKTDIYDDSLRHVDYQVGRLLGYLETSGLSNNTIIIISADHGDDLYGRHGISGHGQSIYNEELKTPLIFFYPEKESEIITSPVSHIDVLPTVINSLNIPLPSTFRGDLFQEEDRIFFYTQNHKYLIGMIKDNLKVIIDLNRELVEVYNLKEDPLELKDLYRDYRYNEQTIELLTWHYCQLNYFSADEKEEDLEKYCESFR